MKINITRHFWAKLFSVILAIIIWFFVTSEKIPEKVLIIPLKLENIPQGLVVANKFDNNISIRIKAAQSIIDNITFRNFKAFIDLSGSRSSENYYKVQLNTDMLPKGAKIVRIEPRAIKIRLENVAKKELPVIANIVNKPAKGYRIIETLLSPDKVIVTGPETIIASLDSILTQPIDLEGYTGSVQKEVGLETKEGLLRLENIANIKVTIKLSRK